MAWSKPGLYSAVKEVEKDNHPFGGRRSPIATLIAEGSFRQQPPRVREGPTCKYFAATFATMHQQGSPHGCAHSLESLEFICRDPTVPCYWEAGISKVWNTYGSSAGSGSCSIPIYNKHRRIELATCQIGRSSTTMRPPSG